jgi:putative membrane protein
MSRVMPITGALAAAMLAVAPGGVAQSTPSQRPNIPWTVGQDSAFRANNDATDSTFIREAIAANYLEIALGRVAESKGADFDVKAFAKRMITEHNSMNGQWVTVAKNNRVRIPLTLDEAGKDVVDRLDDLSGNEFDQAYMTEAIREHEQALAAFRRMANSARASDVRQLASSGVPAIQEHLTLAQEIGRRVGVLTIAGRAGDVTPPTTSRDTGLGGIFDRARRTEDANRDRTARTEDANRNDRGDRSRVRVADGAFIRNLVQNHVTHIRMAELARRESKSSEVRQFAERIENHMYDWGRRWENVADRYDVKVTSNLGRLHQEKVDKVQGSSKKNFDRTYLEVAAGHLESLVPYFQKEGRALQAPEARRLANEELPKVQDLLAKARELQKKAKE